MSDARKANAGFEPVVIGVTPAGVKWVAYSPEKVETLRANFKRMAQHQAGAIYLDMLGTTWQVLEDIAKGNPSLAGRASHLKSLRLKGLIRKNARSKWELTRKGKQVLALARTENPIEGMPGGSVTGCIAQNQDKDDPGAYCAAIADRIEPGWREKNVGRQMIGDPPPIHGNSYQVVFSGGYFYVHDVRKGGGKYILKTPSQSEAHGKAEALNRGWVSPEGMRLLPSRANNPGTTTSADLVGRLKF